MADTPQPESPDTARNTHAISDAPAQVVALGEDQIALVKNGKRHVFTCVPGTEAEVLNEIALMVSDPANGLTWFDAAVLSHQLGERMSKRLEQMTGRRKSA
ncbi:MAG: hypothetical protein ACIAXF_15785 [Phycisphaerales bacterium JB063]